MKTNGSAESIHEEDDEHSDDYDDAVRKFLKDVKANEATNLEQQQQSVQPRHEAKTLKHMAYQDPRL